MADNRQQSPKILFIHPYNHESWHVIPVGVVGMMNSHAGRAAGLYAHEATPDVVRGADIVLMDAHWFFPLANIGAMAREIRKINAEATIAIGGYTAGVFARELLEECPELDFVIAGDGEQPLRDIVEWKQGGPFPDARPGVIHRGGDAGFNAATTPAEYSGQDYISLDWFPSLAALTRGMQEKFRHFEPGRGYDGDVFPQIPVIRGCFTPCANCCGNSEFQRMCGREAPLVRTARALARDLDLCESDPAIHAVNVLGDFLSLADDAYVDEALGADRDLVCYYAFCAGAARGEKRLERLLRSFKYCFLVFIMDFVPGDEFEERLRRIVSIIRKNKNRCAALFSVRGIPHGSGVPEIFGENAVLQAHPEWDMPTPGLAHGDDARATMRHFRLLAEKYAVARFMCLLFPDMKRFLDYRYFPHTKSEHPGASRLLESVRERFFSEGFVAPDKVDFDLVPASTARPFGKNGPRVSSVAKWELQFTLNGYRLLIHLGPAVSRGPYQELEKLVFTLTVGECVFESASSWAVKPLTIAFPDSLREENGGTLEIDIVEGGAPPAARFNGKNVKVS